MSRSSEERVGDVRRLLAAAAAVHTNRALFAADIAQCTGLTREGVELGFESLEREASDSELLALVAAAGDVPRVHVVLSANVFVAPLRALALARAAAPRVTVRPSSRDPIFSRALLQAAGDDAISMSGERDVASIDAGEIHVYGTNETVDAVRARARVSVRAHGAGMGVGVVTGAAEVEGAAEQVAADVVPFDQRGCLSPRIVFVEGELSRARAFAGALDAALRRWGVRVPRGSLSKDERAAATRWQDAVAFAGSLWKGEGHAVALAPAIAPLALPPSGRHLLVVAAATAGDAFVHAAPFAPFVVAVGSDDPLRVAALAPAHARVSYLGRMQHPALDGPVDRR